MFTSIQLCLQHSIIYDPFASLIRISFIKSMKNKIAFLNVSKIIYNIQMSNTYTQLSNNKPISNKLMK